MTAKKVKIVPALASLDVKQHKQRRATRIRQGRQAAGWRKQQQKNKDQEQK